MKTMLMLIALLAVVSSGPGCQQSQVEGRPESSGRAMSSAESATTSARGVAQQPPSSAEASVRIGVYDSRALAVAFAGSKAFEDELKPLMASYRSAESAGNKDEMAKADAKIKDIQARLHKQAFQGSAVDEIVATIPDALRSITEREHLQAIVAKSDKATLERYSNAAQVDVSMELIEALHPNTRQLEIARKMLSAE